MRETVLDARRKPQWEELESLVQRAERHGAGALDAEHLALLVRRYRSATSDLAAARGRGYAATLIDTLNALVARAHAIVYGADVPDPRGSLRRFITGGLAIALRASGRAIAWSAIVTASTALLGYLTVMHDAHAVYALLPDSAIPGEIRRSLHDSNFAVGAAFSPALSAEVITNNVRVAIGAFAGGVTGGVLTVYVLGFNGVYLGALAALFTRAGFGLDFWATIAPHGAIELTAIVIAGGAGFVLAGGLLFPGRLRRVDAFTAAARRAGRLLAGVALLLIWAGVFEGFVSPRRIGPEVRLAIGALNGSLLAAYWIVAGRGLTRSPRS